MHGPINVKSANNISKWQMGFNSAFKGLNLLSASFIKNGRNVIHLLLKSGLSDGQSSSLNIYRDEECNELSGNTLLVRHMVLGMVQQKRELRAAVA